MNEKEREGRLLTGGVKREKGIPLKGCYLYLAPLII